MVQGLGDCISLTQQRGKKNKLEQQLPSLIWGGRGGEQQIVPDITTNPRGFLAPGLSASPDPTHRPTAGGTSCCRNPREQGPHCPELVEEHCTGSLDPGFQRSSTPISLGDLGQNPSSLWIPLCCQTGTNNPPHIHPKPLWSWLHEIMNTREL